MSSAETGNDPGTSEVVRLLRGRWTPVVVAAAIVVASAVGLVVSSGDGRAWRTPTAGDGTYRFALVQEARLGSGSLRVSWEGVIDPRSGYSLGTIGMDTPGMQEEVCESFGLASQECLEAMEDTPPEQLRCTVLTSETDALLQVPEVHAERAGRWIRLLEGVPHLDVAALLDVDPTSVGELEEVGADELRSALVTHHLANMDFSEIYLSFLNTVGTTDPEALDVPSERQREIQQAIQNQREAIRQQFGRTVVGLWIDDNRILRRLSVTLPARSPEPVFRFEVEIYDIGLDEDLAPPSEDDVSNLTAGQAFDRMDPGVSAITFGGVSLPCFNI